MPQAILPAIGIGGAVASAFGSGGKQRQSTDSRSTQNVDLTNTQIETENPEIGGFRSGLLRGFEGLVNEARKPVFGHAQQASFLENLNELTDSAMSRLGSTLGARGAGRSGGADAAFGDIERGRASEAIKFFRDLPFAESEARFNRLTPLLTGGLNFAGRGPTQLTTTQRGTTTGTTTGNQTVQGPGFGRSLLGNLGSLGGVTFGQGLAGGQPFGLSMPTFGGGDGPRSQYARGF